MDLASKPARTGARLWRQPFLNFAIFCLLAVAGVFGIAAWLTWSERAAAIEKAQLNGLTKARLLAEHMAHIFRVTDTLLIRCAETVLTQPRFDGPESRNIALSLLKRFPEISYVILIDARGNLVWSTASDSAPPVNFSDRPYFRQHQAGAEFLVVDPLIGRSSGKALLPLSRSVRDRDGNFVGVVAAGIEIATLNRLLETARTGDGATAALIRDDGTMLARVPESHIGQRIVRGRLFAQPRGAAYGNFENQVSPIDGKPRLIAYAWIEQFPAVVVATREKAEALAPWRAFVAKLAVLVGLILATLALLGWRDWWRMTQLWHNNAQLQQAEANLLQLNANLEQQVEQRTAEVRLAASIVENTAEGAMITDPQAVILSVNRAFTAITGYSAAEVVGRRADVLRSSLQDPDVRQHMWQRLLSAGHWEGDIWNRRKDGCDYLQRQSVNAVTDENGQVTHYISLFSDVTALRKTDEDNRRLAFHDALTGLPNRMLLEDRLNQAISVAQREGHRLSVLFIDLDHFKEVNDRLGHDIGDLLLKNVAEQINGCIRNADTLARLGGDEFVIMTVGVNNEEDCRSLAQKIVVLLGQPIQIHAHTIDIGASVGIALYPEDGADCSSLIKHADIAMYAAKNAGRNRYASYRAGMAVAVALPAADDRAAPASFDI